MSNSIYLNCTNDTLFSCDFFVNGKDLFSGGLPMETLRLRSARRFQGFAAFDIQKNFAHSALDIENIIRAHQLGGLSHRFDQRRKIGCDHRRSAGHRFERSQSETLIKSGEREGFGGAVEHPQSLNWDEAQKTDGVLDT